MKKIIPVLAILGSAVAFAVYKFKKEEQKQLMEFDEDLLSDEEEPSFARKEETVVHKPFVEKEEKAVEECSIAKEIEPNFAPQPDTADIRKFMEETVIEKMPETNVELDILNEVKMPEASSFVNDFENVTKQETSEGTYSAEYPHLTNRMVEDINEMTVEAIEALAKDGDVHEHERPVQHMVSFKLKEDLETFKSKVINKGFVITKGEEEFDLVVLHISPVNKEKLVDNILFLADMAYAYHGEYRGWQSKVSF